MNSNNNGVTGVTGVKDNNRSNKDATGITGVTGAAGVTASTGVTGARRNARTLRYARKVAVLDMLKDAGYKQVAFHTSNLDTFCALVIACNIINQDNPQLAFKAIRQRLYDIRSGISATTKPLRSKYARRTKSERELETTVPPRTTKIDAVPMSPTTKGD